MNFRPFRHTVVLKEGTEYDYYDEYDFLVEGSNPEPYIVKIGIDDLADGELVVQSCECPHHKFREVICKHIVLCKEELKEYGVKFKDGAS